MAPLLANRLRPGLFSELLMALQPGRKRPQPDRLCSQTGASAHKAACPGCWAWRQVDPGAVESVVCWRCALPAKLLRPCRRRPLARAAAARGCLGALQFRQAGRCRRPCLRGVTPVRQQRANPTVITQTTPQPISTGRWQPEESRQSPLPHPFCASRRSPRGKSRTSLFGLQRCQAGRRLWPLPLAVHIRWRDRRAGNGAVAAGRWLAGRSGMSRHKKTPGTGRGECRPSKGWQLADRDQPNLPEVEAIKKAA
jgi:hypothetical protein